MGIVRVGNKEAGEGGVVAKEEEAQEPSQVLLSSAVGCGDARGGGVQENFQRSSLSKWAAGGRDEPGTLAAEQVPEAELGSGPRLTVRHLNVGPEAVCPRPCTQKRGDRESYLLCDGAGEEESQNLGAE